MKVKSWSTNCYNFFSRRCQYNSKYVEFCERSADVVYAYGFKLLQIFIMQETNNDGIIIV